MIDHPRSNGDVQRVAIQPGRRSRRPAGYEGFRFGTESKTRPKANCSGMGGSTISFGDGSFGTATSGVAPLTSFAVCARAESAQSAATMVITAPTRLTFPNRLARFIVIRDLLINSYAQDRISRAATALLDEGIADTLASGLMEDC